MPMFLASSGCGKIEPEGFSSEPHLVQHGRKLARYGDTSLMNARAPSDLLAPGLYPSGRLRRAITTVAASNRSLRVSVSPHFEMRPITLTSPD